jgi:Polysaccharide lyase family 4, domain II
MLRRFFGFSILSALALACSHDETASAHSRSGPRSPEDGVAPRPAVVEPASQPYKIAPVATPGAIAGTVDFEGTAPVAEVIRPSVDQKVCGNTIIAKNVALAGTRVGGAVVWLTDIRAGKAFSLVRRFDLTNDSCTLDPFVQVMLTNGTLNVGSDDRALQTNRFINVGTGQVVAVAPFNDDGEVVPVDRFTVPAEIEVVSEQHPWTHAWMAVLDHPYYAQTAANGTFSIDGVPPGRYRIRAWHPSLGFVDDSVTVAAGQQATVAFRILKAAPAIPTPATAPAESVRPSAATTPAVPILPTASSTPASSSTPEPGPPPPTPRE